MKSWKLFVTVAALGGLMSGFLTACGKKNDNNNEITYGSLYSDGNAVSTRDASIQGVPFHFSIQGIQAYGGYSSGVNGYNPSVNGYNNFNSYNANPYGNSMNGMGAGGTVTFQANLDGYPQSFQTTANWANWVTMGKWYVTHAGMCADVSCQHVVVTVVVAPASSNLFEFRQIAVKKDMRSGRIVGLREFRLANASQATPPQQMMMMF